ncbi:MAG: class I SAM-dependent methyltransferase [Pseudomonadota bacterium]
MSEIILFFSPELAPEVARFEPFAQLIPARQPPAEVAADSLWCDADGLALLSPRFKGRFRLADEALLKRVHGPSDLVRACDLRPGAEVSVLDCFAGFGTDAAVLAQHGARVTCYERSEITWLLLQDYVTRLGLPINARHGDGCAAVDAGAHDVVYLDPMFAPRSKKALPPRAAQHLRDLAVTTPIDLPRVVERARVCARQRVVLKRRPKDELVGTPNHQVTSKTVRFDVYLPSA